jgi:predicted GNAT superfamily acetyltransferase
MSVVPEIVAEAYLLADAAAEAAGVTVRLAESGDMAPVIGLFERTWGAGRSPDRSMLRALDYAGNTVLIAGEAGKAVGATLGFLGWSDGIHLHSHMTAVVPWRRSGGVGYALKLFQRAVCLEHDITEMRWTFDPLIRRNAHFNLVKLGAEVVRFLPDFYGRLDDAITGVDRSDRFEVRWQLVSARVSDSLAGTPRPVGEARLRLPLDVDYERLRADDPAAAALLRTRSRALFTEALDRGLRPELDADSGYVFVPPTVQTPADATTPDPAPHQP